MQEPNQSPESKESLPRTSSENIQEAKNIFSDVVDDVLVRNDLDTILGVVAVVLAILSLIFYITRTFNIPRLLLFAISFLTPVLSGWALRAGFGATGRNKVKLLSLGGIAVGLMLVAAFG
jgi:hypothetical protein